MKTAQERYNEIDNEEENDDDEFIPCSKCDGHDACRDFGCAFELGLGHLVKTEEFF